MWKFVFEVHIYESNPSYEKVFDEYQEKILKLKAIIRRTREIADKKTQFVKEMLYKEMKLKKGEREFDIKISKLFMYSKFKP